MADPEVIVPATAGYTYPAVSPMGDSVTKTNTFTYTYAPLNCLKSADIDVTIHFEYKYDAVGNRLSDVSPNGVYNYTYDAANRIVMANEITYTWDAKGNMLSDGENEYAYAYNHANQLTQLTTEEDFKRNLEKENISELVW